VTILLDGRPVPAHAGESVATALLALGLRAWRRSPRRGEPRGPFCMMGICQECLITIDGRRAQACLVPVRAGMAVATEDRAA
jgi:predicted molibdopterin-dependent oxidoreductase YjgC